MGKVLSWVVQGKKRTIEDIKRLLAHRTTDFADVWLENLGRILIDMYGSKIRKVSIYHVPNLLGQIEEMRWRLGMRICMAMV